MKEKDKTIKKSNTTSRNPPRTRHTAPADRSKRLTVPLLIEARFKAVFESSLDAIGVSKAGIHVFVNPAYLALFGFSQDADLAGKPVLDLIAPESRSQIKTYILRRVQGEALPSAYETRGLRTDGSIFDMEVNVSSYKENNEVNTLVILRDITLRKKAEQKLLESEARLRMVTENSPDTMLKIDRQGIITFINRSVPGISVEQIIGTSVHRWVPKEQYTIVDQAIEKAFTTGQCQEYESPGPGPHGEARLYQVRLMPVVVNGAVESAVYVATDITDQRQVEEARRQSEEKYRRLYNETPVLLHSIDRDARIVDVNDYWIRIMGYERREVIGRSVTDFYTEASRTYAREIVQPAFFRDGIIKDISYQFVKKNGDIVDVLLSATGERDADGRVIRSQAVIEDVTERKKAAEALQKSEERFRDLAESLPLTIFEMDLLGVFTYVNRAALETFGFTLQDFNAGMTIDRVISSADRSRAREAIARRIQGDVSRYGEYQALRKDGTTFPVTVASALILRDGRPAGLRGIVTDLTTQKKAEETLRVSEEKYRSLFDNSEIAMFRTRLDGSEVLDVNQKWLDLVGKTREEALGKPSTIVWEDPNERERMVTMLLANGYVSEFEFNMLNKQKGVRNCITSLRLYRDQGILEGSIADITERTQTVKALRESEERFRAITTTASDAILLMDDNGKIVYWNPAAERIFGYSAADATGQDLHKFLAPSRMHTEYLQGFSRFIKTGQGPVINRSVEMTAMKKSGTEFPIEVSTSAMKLGDRWHALGIVRDITERKQVEQKMREKEGQYRVLFEAANDGIFIQNESGFIDCNQRGAEMYGLSKEKLLGRSPAEFAPERQPDGRLSSEVAGEKIQAALNGVPQVFTWQPLRGDGSPFDVEVTLSRLELGGTTCLQSIVRDIAERKQLEQELLRSTKLDSLGTLAGGIAHDFNNLLQGIFGYISMAKLTYDDKEKSLAMLEQAEKALHQSVNLTSQLLTFSKGGKPVKKVVDIQPVIENSVAFALSGSRNTYKITTGADLHAIEADEGQIGQVIQNIVLNADQAMPLGGMIRVSVRNLPAATLVPAADLQGDLVEISIRDQGTGIPEEHLKRIFDPYFTTKEKGSGLGLATSYSIIKNHGGLIRVQSEVGKGTVFFIYLPASRAKGDKPINPAIPRAKRTGRILVMDDEEMIRAVAGELLVSFGHDVAFADKGESALEEYCAAREAGRPFDLVILDLTIRGGMGGMETMRKLVEIDPNVKAVVSSGYSDDAVLSNYREYGFRAFLKKPYNVQELQIILHTLLM